MDWRRKLLWVDCIAGGIVGIFVLSLAGWLSTWYRLPKDLVLLMGGANAAYAMYSFSLARRSRRPAYLITLLVVANMTWAVLCVRWAVIYWQDASFFGLAQLLLEALFVGGLACLEWRSRELLLTA